LKSYMAFGLDATATIVLEKKWICSYSKRCLLMAIDLNEMI